MTTGDVFIDTNVAHRLVLIITFFSILSLEIFLYE